MAKTVDLPARRQARRSTGQGGAVTVQAGAATPRARLRPRDAYQPRQAAERVSLVEGGAWPRWSLPPGRQVALDLIVAEKIRGRLRCRRKTVLSSPDRVSTIRLVADGGADRQRKMPIKPTCPNMNPRYQAIIDRRHHQNPVMTLMLALYELSL